MEQPCAILVPTFTRAPALPAPGRAASQTLRDDRVNSLSADRTARSSVPLAWTPGTNGVGSGEPTLVSIHNEADQAKYKGKLKGKVVLNLQPKAVATVAHPVARRFTAEQLLARSTAADPAHMGPAAAAAAVSPAVDREAAAKFKQQGISF